MIPPTDQRAGVRPIGFVLDAPIIGAVPPTSQLILPIRPEDLTRASQSRMSVTQALGSSSGNGGAWVDNFGPGLPTINISGHTGWRGGPKSDGLELFQALHNDIFTNWHVAREEALKAGLDPDEEVKLVFVDLLDDIVSVVAPMNFVLKRNKSRPLLVQYQISMQVVEDGVGDQYTLEVEKSQEEVFDLGMKSLEDIVSKIESAAASISNWIDAYIGGPVRAFMSLTSRILGMVTRVQRAIDGIGSSLVRVASDLTRAGANIFHTIAGVLSMPSRIKARIMEVAGAFTTAFCAIKRIFRPKDMMPNYTDIYGASNCSSTAGGSPLSPLRNTNPFVGVAAMSGSTSQSGVSGAASGALSRLVNFDPVMSASESGSGIRSMVSDIRAVNSGVSI